MKLLFGIILMFSVNINSQSIKFLSNDRLILGNNKEKTASLDVGDIDNDGDQDVIVANGRHWPGQNRIFFNNGDGIFTVSRPLGVDNGTSYSTELADFDNDGDLDVAVGNGRAPNNIFVNDGYGNFSKGSTFGNNNSSTRNIVVSDIDLDGDQDILITNRGKENEICINDGKGVFKKTIVFGSKNDSTIDVETADIDKDNDIDLILANRDGQPNYNHLSDGIINEGTPSFLYSSLNFLTSELIISFRFFSKLFQV